MRKDYQVRVEYESDGTEEVYIFDSLTHAQQGFRSTCEKLRNDKQDDDVHVELIEVLAQERIEPDLTEEG